MMILTPRADDAIIIIIAHLSHPNKRALLWRIKKHWWGGLMGQLSELI